MKKGNYIYQTEYLDKLFMRRVGFTGLNVQFSDETETLEYFWQITYNTIEKADLQNIKNYKRQSGIVTKSITL
jgi:hypothetical protein